MLEITEEKKKYSGMNYSYAFLVKTVLYAAQG